MLQRHALTLQQTEQAVSEFVLPNSLIANEKQVMTSIVCKTETKFLGSRTNRAKIDKMRKRFFKSQINEVAKCDSTDSQGATQGPIQ
jgi:hypothetical protein